MNDDDELNNWLSDEFHKNLRMELMDNAARFPDRASQQEISIELAQLATIIDGCMTETPQLQSIRDTLFDVAARLHDKLLADEAASMQQ